MNTEATSGASGGSTAAAGRGRTTPQFRAVIDALSGSDDFRSAQEIHTALRGTGSSIGLATVYRALQTLVDTGRADVLRTGSGEAVYRDCSHTHHHHLVCRSCGRTEEIQGPAVEAWAEQVAAEKGFVDVSHTLELFGTCESCAAPAARGEG